MTIAIGLNCESGALLCSDTKYTGSMAIYEPKIFSRDYFYGSKSAFVVVGNAAFAKMAVRRCEGALAKAKKSTLREMEELIESVLLKVHKEHIFKHPDRNLEGGPDFWLIVALWSPEDGLRTYHTNQTALVPFDLFHCAGSGEYLGRYLLTPIYKKPDFKLPYATTIACTVLMRVKGYDANCGGNSQFLLLSKTGWMGRMHEFAISRIEQFSHLFDETSEMLFADLRDVSKMDHEIEESLEGFKRLVLNYRSKHKQDYEAFMLLAKALENAGDEKG